MIATIIGDIVDVLSSWLQTLGDFFDIGIPLLFFVGMNIALWLGPAIALLAAAKFLIVRPIRQLETAQVFLDLLEMGVSRGRSPENIVVQAASLGEKALGKRFTRLAERIQNAARAGGGDAASRRATGRHPQGITPLSRRIERWSFTRDGGIQLSPGVFSVATVAGYRAIPMHRHHPEVSGDLY